MASRSWRDIARAHIERALEEAREQGLDDAATLKHVDAAYPFGERAYHPYKMWLSERRRLVTKKPTRVARPEFGGAITDEREYAVANGQNELPL